MTDPLDPLPDADSSSEEVPLFGTWRRAYWVVAGVFGIQIVAYSLLTWACG